MRLLFHHAVIFALLISTATASPEKFKSWFPLLSQGTYANVSAGICNQTLAEYRNARQNPDATYRAATCAHQQQCILNNLREDIKARMSSASVLLGLAPGLLASLGPTVAEISLLSLERPVLSLLLSFGSPAVYQSRVLKYEDALDIIKEKTRAPAMAWVTASRRNQALVSGAQYVMASVAIFNVVYTSYQLGVRTIVSFRCVNSFFPLVWTLLPIFIHVSAALAFWRLDSATRLMKSPNPLRTFLGKEFSLCMTRQKRDLGRLEPTPLTIGLNYLATTLGFLHVTFGILIYSSLLFIETLDVVAVILRYMVSVALCRVILMFELAGIKGIEGSQGAAEGASAEELMVVEETRYKRIPV